MTFFRIFPGAVLLCWLLMLPAVASADVYDSYGQLLTKYLVEHDLENDGLISAFQYKAALDDPKTKTLLAEQRQRLADFDPASLDGREQSIAFWINAYNFFMLDQLLTQRPDGQLVESVWDYGGRLNPFVDSVFDRDDFTVGGRQYSLNEFEKEILLGKEYKAKGWKDARVHFAVNCASVGCPPLRKQPYTAGNLEALLTENTRRAFNTDRHLKVDGENVYVTELFKWYEQDFTEAAGSGKAFIREWADASVAERIADTSDMKYIDYDWTLNSPDNFPEIR